MTDETALGIGGERAGRRAPWRRGAIVVAAVVAVVALVVVLRRPPDEPAGAVVLYGDSLSVESRDAFLAALDERSDAEVELRVMPGAAPCDVRPTDDDLAAAPDVVVLQFVGNNESLCTRGPGGEHLTGDALAERYDRDVREIVDRWAEAGSRVVLVGGPEAPGLPGQASAQIAEVYGRIVNEWAGRDLGRVRYADAAAAVSDSAHGFVERLPCRSDEEDAGVCDEGEVTVRAPDRIHLCPAPELDMQTLLCPEPSPGAERYGEEMARVAALALDPGY